MSTFSYSVIDSPCSVNKILTSALTTSLLLLPAVVPPGYLIQNGTLGQCGPGFYRERWVMYSDPKGQACTPCGAGIQSEPRDLDEHPLAVNGSLVRAASTSCCECLFWAGVGTAVQAMLKQPLF